MFERSGLCFLGMFAKGNRGERKRKDCQIESFKVLVTVTVQFQRDRREVMLAEASDMQVCKNDAVWGPLSPQKPNTAPFWDQFPYQSPHDAVLGTKFPTKFPTLDPPIFLSFLVSLLYIWFGLSELMGLGFE